MATSRHLVDPELVAMLDTFPTLTLTPESLTVVRTALEEMSTQTLVNGPDYSAISVHERFIPGPKGAPDVRVLVYLPPQRTTPLPASLWIHGGG